MTVTMCHDNAVARHLAVDAHRARQCRPAEAELDNYLTLPAASSPTPASTRLASTPQSRPAVPSRGQVPPAWPGKRSIFTERAVARAPASRISARPCDANPRCRLVQRRRRPRASASGRRGPADRPVLLRLTIPAHRRLSRARRMARGIRDRCPRSPRHVRAGDQLHAVRCFRAPTGTEPVVPPGSCPRSKHGNRLGIASAVVPRFVAVIFSGGWPGRRGAGCGS